MRKVLVTGRGLLTPLGNGLSINEEALRSGRSGTTFVQDWKDRGMDCQVGGFSDQNPACDLLDKKRLRFAPANARMSVVAVQQALQEAAIPLDEVRSHRIAVISGVAGSNYQETYEAARAYERARPPRGVDPPRPPPVKGLALVPHIDLLVAQRHAGLDHVQVGEAERREAVESGCPARAV